MERKAAFSLRVSANSLAWIGPNGVDSILRKEEDTDIYLYGWILS